jgi:hypothetical protein
MLDDLDLSPITDDRSRALIVRLLNLVEDLSADLRAAQAEMQQLRDEINRLKGEQGKPTIKPGRKADPAVPADHSSERERHCPTPWTKGRKRAQIPIDREQVLQVDPATLPPDAEFKGYEPVVVQDLRFQTDHVRFLKEKFYSATQRRTYLAELPAGYRGSLDPASVPWCWSSISPRR